MLCSVLKVLGDCYAVVGSRRADVGHTQQPRQQEQGLSVAPSRASGWVSVSNAGKQQRNYAEKRNE